LRVAAAALLLAPTVPSIWHSLNLAAATTILKAHLLMSENGHLTGRGSFGNPAGAFSQQQQLLLLLLLTGAPAHHPLAFRA